MRHVKWEDGQLTPLDRFENSSLKLVGEPGMHGTGLLSLALQRLEVVQATLAGDLALEVFHSIEGHPGCIGTGG